MIRRYKMGVILKKILIVEDDVTINHMLKEVLQKEGFLCE